MCNNPQSLWIWVCPDDNNTIFFPILTLKNNKMKCSVKVLATTTNFCRRWYLHLTPVIVLLLMSNSTFDLMSLFVLKAFWSFSKCLTWCLWVNWSSGFSFLSPPAEKESKSVYSLQLFIWIRNFSWRIIYACWCSGYYVIFTQHERILPVLLCIRNHQ